jgi:hypothetical protein
MLFSETELFCRKGPVQLRKRRRSQLLNSITPELEFGKLRIGKSETQSKRLVSERVRTGLTVDTLLFHFLC